MLNNTLKKKYSPDLVRTIKKWKQPRVKCFIVLFCFLKQKKETKFKCYSF